MDIKEEMISVGTRVMVKWHKWCIPYGGVHVSARVKGVGSE